VQPDGDPVTKRKAAKRPAPRTVEVTIAEGDFAGWWAIARADFPFRLVEEIESGQVSRVRGALEEIILEHNMPDETGDVAEHLRDVDPAGGVVAIAEAIGDAIGQLPNR
jgi:hypothetical protein